jgi:hypothetical protein
MAETGKPAAWVGQDKGFEKISEAFRQQEDGHITCGAIAPN